MSSRASVRPRCWAIENELRSPTPGAMNPSVNAGGPASASSSSGALDAGARRPARHGGRARRGRGRRRRLRSPRRWATGRRARRRSKRTRRWRQRGRTRSVGARADLGRSAAVPPHPPRVYRRAAPARGWGMAVEMHRQLMAMLPELRYQPVLKRVRVALAGELVADTRRPVLVWEPTRVVPSYAVPGDDVDRRPRAGDGRTTTGRTGPSASVTRAQRCSIRRSPSPCTRRPGTCSTSSPRAGERRPARSA